MARRQVVSRGRTPRLVQWVAPADQGYVAVITGGKTIISSEGFTSKNTIVRMRGQVSVKPEVLAADVDIVGALGVGIVSTDAFGAGAASVPGPFLQADWPGWFVWRSFSYHFEFQDATGIHYPMWDFEVDSKAMRKVSQNETVVIMAESQVGAFRISTPLRMLVKLS